MKKLTVKIVICTLFLSACQNKKDPYFFLQPQAPTSQPISLDSAQKSLDLDFWIVPNTKLDMNYPVTIGLSYKFKFDNDIRERVAKTPIPLKLKIFLIKNQQQETITFDAKTQEKEGYKKGLINASVIATPHNFFYPSEADKNIGQEEYIAAVFHPPEHGHYRVEVTTEKDNPDLKTIEFELFVKQINLGK
ncbi:MAG: hypothetical protein ACRCV6_04850 [Formosimonas sp.]